MANNLTGNPLVIDTAGVVSTTPVRVMTFLFKPNTTSDQVVLQDSTGRVVLDLMANATTAEKQIVFEPHDSRFYGLTCTTLSESAILYVYLNPTCS